VLLASQFDSKCHFLWKYIITEYSGLLIIQTHWALSGSDNQKVQIIKAHSFTVYTEPCLSILIILSRHTVVCHVAQEAGTPHP